MGELDADTAPIDDGQGEAPDATPEAPSYETIDLEQYGDYRVPISVDGNEEMVPLTDLRGGYMRQADYTRKTQELASQREQQAQAVQLQEAFQADPQGTARALYAYFNGDGDGQPTEDDDAFVDPLEREVQDLRQWQTDMQEREQIEAHTRTLHEMHQTYGLDPEELVSYAVNNQVPNLEWAAKMLMAERLNDQNQQTQQRTADGEQARLEAKREAAIISGGTSRQAGSQSAPVSEVSSVADAFAMAKSQLGMA